MATYTISVNERTNGGKALMAYLRDLGVLVESRKTVKKVVICNLKRMSEREM